MPKKILISNQVSYPGYVVPGSLQDKCSRCGEPVWISPSSLLILHDNPGTDIACTECGLKQMATEPGEIDKPTPAQRDEIEEYLKGHAQLTKDTNVKEVHDANI